MPCATTAATAGSWSPIPVQRSAPSPVRTRSCARSPAASVPSRSRTRTGSSSAGGAATSVRGTSSRATRTSPENGIPVQRGTRPSHFGPIPLGTFIFLGRHEAHDLLVRRSSLGAHGGEARFPRVVRPALRSGQLSAVAVHEHQRRAVVARVPGRGKPDCPCSGVRAVPVDASTRELARVHALRIAIAWPCVKLSRDTLSRPRHRCHTSSPCQPRSRAFLRGTRLAVVAVMLNTSVAIAGLASLFVPVLCLMGVL